uniref:Variable outer membrane protein n=1 Tax=Anisakis simplex TaxID=6269 RepID=A0A0M3JN96_ANISI
LKAIAANITKEQGKTLPDAEGDVTRGLQVNSISYFTFLCLFFGVERE